MRDLGAPCIPYPHQRALSCSRSREAPPLDTQQLIRRSHSLYQASSFSIACVGHRSSSAPSARSTKRPRKWLLTQAESTSWHNNWELFSRLFVSPRGDGVSRSLRPVLVACLSCLDSSSRLEATSYLAVLVPSGMPLFSRLFVSPRGRGVSRSPRPVLVACPRP